MLPKFAKSCFFNDSGHRFGSKIHPKRYQHRHRNPGKNMIGIWIPILEQKDASKEEFRATTLIDPVAADYIWRPNPR